MKAEVVKGKAWKGEQKGSVVVKVEMKGTNCKRNRFNILPKTYVWETDLSLLEVASCAFSKE